MSKDIAKKLIAELQTNTELKAKIAGIEDKDELVKIAVQNGYDVTLEEMTEAEKEFRAELAAKSDRISDELTAEELAAAAGGLGKNDAPDGHELFCGMCYHDYDYSEKNDVWCTSCQVMNPKTKEEENRLDEERKKALHCKETKSCFFPGE